MNARILLSLPAMGEDMGPQGTQGTGNTAQEADVGSLL